MSESSTEDTPAAPAQEPAATKPAEGGPGEHDDWKARAREWEKRAAADAKARERAERERDELKQQHMTAAEKELARARKEALEEGRAAALTEVGKELVAAELRAVLKGRHDDPDTVIDALDPGRFLKDGRPDREAIKAWADKAHPERQAAFASIAQGRREQSPATDMNTLIRRAAGHQV